MAKHRRMSDDAPQPATEDSGATYWSVAEGDWPAGPADLADLLAPPIVVGVARVVATSRMTPPETDRPGRAPARSGAAGLPATAGATTVRLNAGSRPAASTRRPATPGRHRNPTA
ncbi:hypothetical protein GA0070622_1830 [Micromonospora sediminicola]|uniref:Uncharacterized protein n=2 Tax=Micromonosporaceae TaxID=28056 RepID=A0A1A9B6X6_9ACTN|nr:hypothetical protein COO58_21875 [Micromonospora sp. WMMA1996]SBT64848.1 hypothetical protein GA0070622_1830 [Micromonospora sediminicola]